MAVCSSHAADQVGKDLATQQRLQKAHILKVGSKYGLDSQDLGFGFRYNCRHDILNILAMLAPNPIEGEKYTSVN